MGAAGFLLLLGVIIVRRKPAWAPEELLRPLAVLTLLAVLLGTIGVPIVFAALYFVSKAIRSRQGFDLDLVYTEIPPS